MQKYMIMGMIQVDEETYRLLQGHLKRLEQENTKLGQENENLRRQVDLLLEQVRLLRHHRFGASSERTLPHKAQLYLFNEPEVEARPEEPEPAIETVVYTRRKRPRRGEERLEGLPTERVDYTLPPEEQVCPNCHGPLHEMSTEVRRELKIVPAQKLIVEHVQHLYACRACEKKAETTPIVKAPMPRPLQPKSLASPSAVAYIMARKFAEGMPLYRQEQAFAASGMGLSRQTMANWILFSSKTYLERIYGWLHEDLLGRRYLHADETPVQVLHEPGRRADQTSYMWVYRSGRDGPPVVLFDYEETRAGDHPKQFLSGFSGYLHVDGYPGYHDLPGVTLVGCWSHARRKFDEAVKSLPPGKRAGAQAAEGLSYCNRLFAIERKVRDASPEERRRVREEESRAVLDAFLVWLDRQRGEVLPQSALGKAVTYCLGQWPKLTTFLEDGNLELDNNAAERAIKPFVIGRRNWLFANTQQGARASAVVYSLVETAKENRIDPYRYLEYVLTRLANMDPDDTAGVEELLPWSEFLPKALRRRP